MTTIRQLCPEGSVYRAATELALDESYAEQARRRAARWHAWLKSPECTFQDRENFERWCSDVTNAAAYVELCGDLAAPPELTTASAEDDGFGYDSHARPSAQGLARAEADTR
jgi:ferric-dicitrate binding protein FerR (iron transport regulator)